MMDGLRFTVDGMIKMQIWGELTGKQKQRKKKTYGSANFGALSKGFLFGLMDWWRGPKKRQNNGSRV
jgi:hypothetical protein